jgi:stage III sporulation protein AA
MANSCRASGRPRRVVLKEVLPTATALRLQQITAYLAPSLRAVLDRVPLKLASGLEEIRLRRQFPLSLRCHQEECFIDGNGQPVAAPADAYLVCSEEVETTLQLIFQGSVYAYEEELRQGFLTLPGGHRVGLAGKVVLAGAEVRTMRDIGSLNFRLARAVPGCARKLLPHLLNFQDLRPYHTLLVSPPRAGKTTMLRDLVRMISGGVAELHFPGLSVGVADERGELAACFSGVPQHDLGPRVDVLDHCPKGTGMLMLLRSMSPDVMVTDEIGRAEDVTALWEMVNTGLSVLATAHASSFEELSQRPHLRELVSEKVFQRYVFLSRRHGPGTVDLICDAGQRRIYAAAQ